MTLESGQLILDYVSKRPFRISSYEVVGISGRMVEDAMWGLLKEYRKVTTTDLGLFSPSFTVYAKQGTSFTFEPTTSGYFLETSGESSYTDYINDMRQYLGDPNVGTPSIFSHMANDCDYTHAEIKDSYHKAYFGNTPSGKITGIGNSIYNSGDFNYPFYNSDGIPPTGDGLFLGYLGSSGSLLDLDFDEVLYQPYPRLAKLRQSGIAISTTTFNNRRIISPLYPQFCKTDLSLIHTTTTDNTYKFNTLNGIPASSIDNYGDQSHIQSGFLRVCGDTIEPINTSLRIVNTDKSLIWQGSGLRRISPVFNPKYQPLLESGQVPGSRGFFGPSGGTISEGLYKVALVHTSLPSGNISIWPPLINSSGIVYTTLGGYKSIACLNITNNILCAASNSGLTIYSPLNGMPLWTRLPVPNINNDTKWKLTGESTTIVPTIFKNDNFIRNVHAVSHPVQTAAWAIKKYTFADLEFDSSGLSVPSPPDSSGFATHSYTANEGSDGNMVIVQKIAGIEAMLHIINPNTFALIRTIGGDPDNPLLNAGGALTDSKMLRMGIVGSNEYALIGTPSVSPGPEGDACSGIALLSRIPTPSVNDPFTIGTVKPVLLDGTQLGLIWRLFGDDSNNTYVSADLLNIPTLSYKTLIFKITEGPSSWNVTSILSTEIMNGFNPRDDGIDGIKIQVYRSY